MNANEAVQSLQLKSIPLFADFNETDCRQIADVASVVTFDAEKLILKQGQVSRDLWIVLEGVCEVSRSLDTVMPDPKRMVLATLESPSHFGDMSFFHPDSHSADVRAVGNVTLLKISYGDYKELVNDGVKAAYKLAYNVTVAMARRLRHMDDWIAEMVSDAAGTVHDTNTSGLLRPEWTSFREKVFDRWNL